MSSPYPPAQFPDQQPKPSSSSSTTTIVLIVVLALAAGGCVCGAPCLIALLLPAVQMAREAARQQQSMNNLKQIGVALHHYHDNYGTLPPAYIPDATGKPRTSWRTLILPFLEQKALHDQYDFNVAWDDPKNDAVRRTRIVTYQSPRKQLQNNGTSYVVITGPSTAFPGAQPQRFVGIKDGLTNTIAVMEIQNSDIEWSEPRDIDLSAAFVRDPSAPNSINFTLNAVVLYADGSVRRLPRETSMETLRAMLTAAGGESVTPP